MAQEQIVNLKQLILAHQRANAQVQALGQQVEELKLTGGEPNVITAVKNNGEVLPITDKAVDIAASIAAAVAGEDHLRRKKVASLDAIDPEAADAAKYIYMVPREDSKDGNKYDEYMVMDGAVERVGDWAVDLSGYVQVQEGKGLSSNDYTDADKAKLDGLRVATDEEVAAALDEIFGPAQS